MSMEDKLTMVDVEAIRGGAEELRSFADKVSSHRMGEHMRGPVLGARTHASRLGDIADKLEKRLSL